MLTLSKVVSAACILLTTPSPPKICKAPLVVVVASVPSQTLVNPPTFRFSSIPTPPVVTIKAPVSLSVDVVLFVTVTLSASTFSRLASVA